MPAGTQNTVYNFNTSDLLQGFTDADNDILSITNLTATHGSVINNLNGTWSFTPDTGYNGAVALSYTVTDGKGGNVPASQNFTLTPAGSPIVIAGTDFVTDENGNAAVFSVSLATQPNRDVTIAFASSDTSEGVIANPTLTFTSSNWATAQTLTVTGIDDAVLDNGIAYQITATVNTLDVNYAGLTVNPITLTNNDNEVPPSDIYGDVGGSKKDILVGTAGDDHIYGLNMADDLSGGLGNDVLYGGYGNDVISGQDGDDTLYGEQDNDYLEGGNGNDTLDGGLGLDTMTGGTGNDTYYLGYDAIDVITDNGLSTDVDTVIMPYQLTSYTLPTGIENGTIADGTQASNLTGNTSDNTLTGNNGNNQLNGAVGRDSLFGGVGDDVLTGGDGNDVLTGGLGNDVFQFDAALTLNIDTITDFTVANDAMQLNSSVFTGLALGTLAASAFVIGTVATDSANRIIYDNTSGTVYFDDDGSGNHAAVQIMTIGTNLALTNSMFMVV